MGRAQGNSVTYHAWNGVCDSSKPTVPRMSPEQHTAHFTTR